MRHCLFFILVTCGLIAMASITACAQGADGRNPWGQRDLPSRGVREMYQRMRIEKERKDYEEMLSKADEAAKLASQVELGYSQRGSLTKDDLARIESVERSVKSVRSKLGGGDGDDEDDNNAGPLTETTAVESLKSMSEKLLDEVKRSTRFAISVPAIEASNDVLKAARFLLHK